MKQIKQLWLPLVSILLLFFLSQLALSTLSARLFPLWDETFTLFLSYVGGFVVTIGYSIALKPIVGWQVPSLHPEKWRGNPRLVVGGLILMLAASIVLAPLLDTLPESYMESVNNYMQGGFWPMFTAIVAAPICEEFLFRGIIQKNLTDRLGPLTGIIVGAVIFGAVHLVPQQMIYAATLGLILGSVYYLTGSLNNAIAIHFVNNGLTSLLYLTFGRSTGLEEELLGNGALWYTCYIVSALLLLGGAFYVVRYSRRHRIAAPQPPAPDFFPAQDNDDPEPDNSGKL